MSRLRGQLHDPLLSVVMPVFNELATVEEVIRRVLNVPVRLAKSRISNVAPFCGVNPGSSDTFSVPAIANAPSTSRKS